MRWPYNDFTGDTSDDYKEWKHIISIPGTKLKGKAFLREALSGITVALAQVPEAVAFSFTAGVDPIIGLQAAWIICFITAIGGGSPGMVSGATGAIAVVLPDFVKENGVGFLFVAVILMGLIQTVLGFLGAGKLVRLIGAPTMIGFVNGLAIVIFLAQFHTFKYESCPHLSSNDNETEEHIVYGPFEGCWLDGVVIGWQMLLIFVTMFVIYFLPKLTKGFPASLAGIIIATIVEFALIRPIGYKTPLVEDLASVKGFFPIPVWLDSTYRDATDPLLQIPSLFELETYKICLPISITLAIIGLVESLLTLQLVSEITKRKSNAKAECLAQGVANIITGILGGMGGCAMIGQSMINVKSGGVTRISSSIAGLMLLSILLVAYPLINLIPVAALTGVMFMVVIGTFDWSSLILIFSAFLPEKIRKHDKISWHKKVKRTDVLIIIVVTIVAVLVNLAVAVGVGVCLATLFFAWQQSQNHNFDVKEVESNDKTNTKHYQLIGPLFFATSQEFEKRFNAKNDAFYKIKNVELDVSTGSLSDFSAIASLNNVARSYDDVGISFSLRGVNEKCLNMIHKAKHLMFSHDSTKPREENELELEKMDKNLGNHYSAGGIRNENDGEFQLSKESTSSKQKEPIKTTSDSSSTDSANDNLNKISKA